MNRFPGKDKAKATGLEQLNESLDEQAPGPLS